MSTTSIEPVPNTPVEGDPEISTCIPTDEFRSFKIDKQFTRRGILASNVSNPDTVGTEVSKRQNYELEIAFGAAIASAEFAYQAAGVCPATAKADEVNQAQCGIAVTASVMSALFAAYQFGGLVRNRGPNTKREIMLGDLPHNNESLIEGHRVSFDYLAAISEPDGTPWHHYTMQFHDLEADYKHNATVKFHPTENKQVAFASHTPEEGNDDGLEKRGVPAVAYYAWSEADSFYYDHSRHTKSVTQRLAADIWNHGHDLNIASFCASMMTRDAGHRWNDGYFALIKGVFTDHPSNC